MASKAGAARLKAPQGDLRLSAEDLAELQRRSAAAEEAERRGETISFDELLVEVDAILYGPPEG